MCAFCAESRQERECPRRCLVLRGRTKGTYFGAGSCSMLLARKQEDRGERKRREKRCVEIECDLSTLRAGGHEKLSICHGSSGSDVGYMGVDGESTISHFLRGISQGMGSSGPGFLTLVFLLFFPLPPSQRRRERQDERATKKMYDPACR